MTRRTLPLLVLATVLVTPSLAQTPKAKPVFEDGQAQVVPAFSDKTQWIRETLWVETDFDSDKDGKPDRMHVDVTRPKQTETEGLRVPVVYESSPYFAGTADGGAIMNDVHQELGAEPKPRTNHPDIKFDPNKTWISNDFVTQWVPRGFAVVHSEAPGTGLSTGSPTVGDLPERMAPKAVIDWLCGRAKGYTTIDGHEQIYAKWCSGKVGMTGTSYNGTIPVAAATTGVEGLEAIIPVAPNTSYYHYYRSNGLVRSPGGWLGEDIDSLYDFINSGNPANRARGNALYRDGEFAKGRNRQNGDENEFWQKRDLLRFAGGIKCAVLMAHAFNDWNVVPEHSVRISLAIKGKVPLVQYFHQGGHGGEPPFELMNKWFTRYLYGIKNGVEDGPKAYIVREDGKLATYADYPNPQAKPVVLYPSQGGNSWGNLRLKPSTSHVHETLIDDVNVDAPTLAKADSSPNRLIYVTPVLTKPLHLSGFARIKINLSSSKPAANLSVYLVQLPWEDGRISPANLITRGWADPQNYQSLTKGGNYDSLIPGVPLNPGKFYPLTFDLEPDDQIIPAGKRIGLMVLSSDKDFTLWPSPGTKLTVDLDATSISLPVVGGQATFEDAINPRN